MAVDEVEVVVVATLTLDDDFVVEVEAKVGDEVELSSSELTAASIFFSSR